MHRLQLLENKSLKRSLLAALTLPWLMLVTSGGLYADTATDVLVRANGEQLRGQLEDKIAIFRGIPFAKPPVGDLRWREPQSAVPRSGIQSAVSFASACMQTRYNTDWYRDIIKAYGGDPDRATTPKGVSEDCLYLNVWSPKLGADGRLPVMVFIHGGSNVGGWSYEPNYLGHKLAAKGVVVVSIAYRLGVFGFYAHPQLTEESPNSSSGNYGILDQIKALEWIHENIATFGGDPENLTVFGESAGGANISHLMLSPLAKGLFKNAIRQSSSFDINYRDTLSREESFGVEFAESLSSSSIGQLRELPADEVLSNAESFYRNSDDIERRSFRGAVDGYVLSDSVAALYKKGRINPVSVLLGSNADEKLMYSPKQVSGVDIDRLIDRYYQKGKRAAVLTQVQDQPTNRKKYAKLADAREYSCTAQMQADALIRAGTGDVYLYYFTRVRPGAGGELLGSYHGAELPYVFDTHDDWLSGNRKDRRLTDSIMSYWVNFARSGNPNGSKLPLWPSYHPVTRLAMELGDSIATMNAPNRALCDLLGPPQP
ncbi:MAG: carboxylesterase/lipase family protein [Halioglobus sp.]